MEEENRGQVLLRIRDAYLAIITSMHMDSDNVMYHENRVKRGNIRNDRNSQTLILFIVLLVILILSKDLIVTLLN